MKAIVIVANGWHAGWLGCYGNEWLRTHNLDRLAAESVVFDQHYSIDPSPTDWRRSIATGCYPRRLESSPPPSLIASLRSYGVRTLRVHDLKGYTPADVAADWSESIAVPKLTDATPGESIYLQIDHTLQAVAESDNWLLWIETDRFVPPWDVSLDFFDEYAPDMAFLEEGEEPQPWDEPPLGPRDVNDRDLERLQTTFASVVTEWDVELAEWFELFREHKLDESAIWAVTAGFGLSLGEHGWIGPSGHRPFEELGHVPLLLRLPNAAQAGRRIPALSASIDVMPTLLEFFGARLSASVHGKSLAPLAHGDKKPLHAFVCQSLEVNARSEQVVRTPEWALFKSSAQSSLLFRKPEDRWEVNDLRQKHLEWAEHLEAVLAGATANPNAPPVLKSYDEIMQSSTGNKENNHADSAPGERDNG